MRTGITLILIMLLTGSALAAPFGTIKSVKSLPINGVKIIESDKGVFFVSENARFAWKGPIYDLWNGKEVQTMQDADNVVNHVDLKKIGLKAEQLATLTFGHGKDEELIFVSSSCPHCQKLLQQALALKDKYRFRVVLVPMGQKSLEQTRKLICAKDQEAAVKALVSGNYEALKTEDCSQEPLQHTLVAARVLGIRSVPYLIRHDGRVQTGGLRDLEGWLAGKNEPADLALGAQKEKQK